MFTSELKQYYFLALFHKHLSSTYLMLCGAVGWTAEACCPLMLHRRRQFLNILWMHQFSSLPHRILHFFRLYCNVVQFLKSWQGPQYSQPVPTDNHVTSQASSCYPCNICFILLENGYDSKKVTLFTMHEHACTESSSELHNFSYSLLAVWRSACCQLCVNINRLCSKAVTVLSNACIISMNLHYSSRDQVPMQILNCGVQT